MAYINMLSGMSFMKTFITLFIILHSISTVNGQDDPSELDEQFLEFDTILSTDTSSVTITHVETFPQFPGGIIEFHKYVKNNQVYPILAKSSNIEGKVTLSFEILADGTVNENSVKVMNSPSELLNKEAIRLITNSPPWIKATRSKEGETPIRINSRTSLPILFRLEN